MNACDSCTTSAVVRRCALCADAVQKQAAMSRFAHQTSAVVLSALRTNVGLFDVFSLPRASRHVRPSTRPLTPAACRRASFTATLYPLISVPHIPVGRVQSRNSMRSLGPRRRPQASEPTCHRDRPRCRRSARSSASRGTRQPDRPWLSSRDHPGGEHCDFPMSPAPHQTARYPSASLPRHVQRNRFRGIALASRSPDDRLVAETCCCRCEHARDRRLPTRVRLGGRVALEAQVAVLESAVRRAAVGAR